MHTRKLTPSHTRESFLPAAPQPRVIRVDRFTEEVSDMKSQDLVSQIWDASLCERQAVSRAKMFDGD